MTHYRAPLTFSWEALEGAKNALNHLKEKVRSLNRKDKTVIKKGKFLERGYVLEALNDDLNIPIVLATIWEALKESALSDAEKIELVKNADKILGLDLIKKQKEEKIPAEIKKLAEEREKARKNKDWKKSDELRNRIQNAGYTIEDSEKGFRIKKQ